MNSAPNVEKFLRNREGLLTTAQPKYILEDCNVANEVKSRIIKQQEKRAEKLTVDSRRLMDEIHQTTKDWQREVDHQLKQRVEEIQFICDELNKQKKSILLEREAVATGCNRIKNTLRFLGDKGIKISQQCMVWRQKRIGAELCDDDVDRELSRELGVMKGAIGLLNGMLKKAEDQVRKLSAASVLIDEDLEFKSKALQIDKRNMKLKDTDQNLGVGQDLSQNICRYAMPQWEHETYKNLQDNAKELSLASQMRSFIDVMLSQAMQDIRNQTENTNLAFNRRIGQIKEIKRSMEEKHEETLKRILDIKDIIHDLETKLVDKERAMLLCKTRLTNRAVRPGLELACDNVHVTLNLELQALQVSMCKLKQKLAENKAMLRYLLHIQLMQEEDLNIKTNTLKIDEVDCMTLRLGLVFTSF